jgi:hypothetical protein
VIAGVRGKELDDARSLGVSDMLAIDDDKATENFRLPDRTKKERCCRCFISISRILSEPKSSPFVILSAERVMELRSRAAPICFPT